MKSGISEDADVVYIIGYIISGVHSHCDTDGDNIPEC